MSHPTSKPAQPDTKSATVSTAEANTLPPKFPTKFLALVNAATPSPRSGLVLMSGARLGELRRAAIVFEAYAFAARNPALGRCAVVNTVLLAHRGEAGISERSLWRWLAVFDAGGISALLDHKRGRVGAKRKVKP